MKAFEDAMKIRLGNALAVVFHDYFGVIVPIKPDVYAYTRFSRTVANGVFQKVGPDGFQVFRIGWQCDMTLARKLNFIAILFGHGAEPLNGGFAGAGEIESRGAIRVQWQEGEEKAHADIARIAKWKDHSRLGEEPEHESEVTRRERIFLNECAPEERFADMRFGRAKIDGSPRLELLASATADIEAPEAGSLDRAA